MPRMIVMKVLGLCVHSEVYTCMEKDERTCFIFAFLCLFLYVYLLSMFVPGHGQYLDDLAVFVSPQCKPLRTNLTQLAGVAFNGS